MRQRGLTQSSPALTLSCAPSTGAIHTPYACVSYQPIKVYSLESPKKLRQYFSFPPPGAAPLAVQGCGFRFKSHPKFLESSSSQEVFFAILFFLTDHRNFPPPSSE